MTLNNFRTLIRMFFPNAKINPVTNPALDLIINAGVLDIATYTACLKANTTFNVTAEDDTYNLSSEISDFLVMDKPGLWWNAGSASSSDWKKVYSRTLKWLDLKRPTWRDEGSDDPLDCSIDGDIITVVPKPDTTLADGFKIYYGKKPTPMSAGGHYSFSGTTTELSNLSVFDDAIIEYALWKLRKAFNKGEDSYRLGENAYLRVREEKFSLWKRRPDISASKDTKLQGPKFRR